MSRAGQSDRSLFVPIWLFAVTSVTKAVTKGALSEASDIRATDPQRLPVAAWRSQRRSASHRQNDLGEAAGSTYRVAQRLSAAFAAKTDRLIAEARNEVSLTGDELIDLVPQRFDLSDPEIVEPLLTGCDVEVGE